MIEYIEGTLIEIQPQKAIVVAGGIGYGIFITLFTFDKLCGKLGEKVIMHTTQIVREDSNRLFGFLEKTEKTLFETLHPAVGPKTTIAMLGHLSKELIQESIEMGLIDNLIKVPGIGKKSAERICVELKGKLQNICMQNPAHEEAILALVHLGYTNVEAKKRIIKAQELLSSSYELKELLKVALQLKTC